MARVGPQRHTKIKLNLATEFAMSVRPSVRNREMFTRFVIKLLLIVLTVIGFV